MNPPPRPQAWRRASLLAVAVVVVQTAVLGCSTPALAVRPAVSPPQSTASTAPAAPVNDAFERGMTQLGARQFAQALQTFRAGAATDTTEPFLRAMIGYCEMLLKDDDAAARDARQALEMGAEGPARSWALLTQGDLALRHQDTARAVAVLTEASSVEPPFATVWAALGDAQSRVPGGADAALRAYRRSLQIDPVYTRPIAGLARLFAGGGKVDEALALLEPALSRAPGDAELLRCRGIILFDIGKVAEAEKDFREAIKSGPEDGALWVELGNALDMEKQFPEAEAAYQKAIVLGKGRVEAHFNLAVSLVGQGKLEAALAEVTAELETNPGHPMARKLQEQLRRQLHR
jgi:Flp pilus assembly protein TadD